jgi:hypothetical protein
MEAIAKFLFPLLVRVAFWLGAKGFGDGTVRSAEEHGRLSHRWVWRHVYLPRERAALVSPSKLDDVACAFARGFCRFDVDEREQQQSDRETRGSHPGI